MLFAEIYTGNPMNWGVVVPVVFGFVTIWLMLPSPQRKPIVWPAICGIAALVGVAIYLSQGIGHGIDDVVENLLFTSFSTLAVSFAGLMIAQRNPARAAICFALVVLSVCGLFLLLAAPFLMAASIIIYAGAIIVTFLFVLMLSQQHGMTDANDRSREPFLASLVGFVFLGTLLVGLQRVYSEKGIDAPINMCNHFAEADALDENFKNPGFVESFLQSIISVKERLALSMPVQDKDKKEYLAPADAVTKIESAIINLRNEFSGKPNLGEVKANCREIANQLNYLKAVREGTLNPNTDVHTSANSVSKVVVTDPSHPASANRLPAANVAALGRSLFTDHLLAIELGGTLLLVATIGAIAIAGTRQERAKV